MEHLENIFSYLSSDIEDISLDTFSLKSFINLFFLVYPPNRPQYVLKTFHIFELYSFICILKHIIIVIFLCSIISYTVNSVARNILLHLKQDFAWSGANCK